MPIKILQTSGTLDDQIEALRKTIKNGEGLTLEEVSAAVGRSIPRLNTVCRKHGWLVKQFSPESRNYLNLLVNEKTLKLCRKK